MLDEPKFIFRHNYEISTLLTDVEQEILELIIQKSVAFSNYYSLDTTYNLVVETGVSQTYSSGLSVCPIIGYSLDGLLLFGADVDAIKRIADQFDSNEIATMVDLIGWLDASEILIQSISE
jgi:hypothetical protein